MIKGEISDSGSPIIKTKIIGSRAEIVTDERSQIANEKECK